MISASSILRIRRASSNGNRRGDDEYTTPPFGKIAATFPAEALSDWIACVGRPEGPLLRVIEGPRMDHQRMSERVWCSCRTGARDTV